MHRKTPSPFLEKRIAGFFDRHVGQGPMIIKEPRTVMTIDAWAKGASNAGLLVHFVVPVRHPAAVCASLIERDRITAEHAALLWLKYSLLSEYASRIYPHAMVDYQNVLRNWFQEIMRIRNILNIPLAVSNFEAAADFVKPEHCHHALAEEISPIYNSQCRAVYKELLRASFDEPRDTDLLDSIRADLEFLHH